MTTDLAVTALRKLHSPITDHNDVIDVIDVMPDDLTAFAVSCTGSGAPVACRQTSRA